MLNSIDPQWKFSTDRAVMLASVVLLPTVFGFFVVRHLWPAAERTPEWNRASSFPAGQSQRLAEPANDGGAPHGPIVAPPREARPLPVHAVPIVCDADEFASSHQAHAPLELSMAGRAVVDPRAFVPAMLPVHRERPLKVELAAAATELDLYGSEPPPDNRFESIKREVTDERSRFQTTLTELADEARRGRSTRRRTRGRDIRQLTNLLEQASAARQLAADTLHQADLFKPRFQPLKNWLRGRSDLTGLPLAMGEECRLKTAESTHLEKVSTAFRSVRRFSTVKSPGDRQPNNSAMLTLVRQFDWQKEDIPGLVQVLSAEETPLRLELVDILSRIQTPDSTAALARLATFDVAAEVREEAVGALDGRPREESREVLLAGLRHVWPPAAEHAAHALVTLDDSAACRKLEELVGQRDPRAPYRTADDRWAARELVRVNHLRNCLLCHAPAVSPTARVTAAVPSPYERLPVEYYQGSVFLVRADVTYLRQDFSVAHAVEDPGPWPTEQRYDYFVRQRNLSEEEATELSRRYSHPLYPQRQAVLFALNKLHRQ